MVSILDLWLPILVAAVLVFIASSIIHMLLKYHQTDFSALPDEEGVMNALRPFGIAPGEYVMPHASTNAEQLCHRRLSENLLARFPSFHKQ